MNRKIDSSEELKLLGVTIDDQLSFGKHISEVCKRASRQVGVLTPLRNLTPTKAKLQIYKSAALPHLTYCHIISVKHRIAEK